MAYTKTNWANDNPPPLDATNLNKIEQGIADVHTMIVANGQIKFPATQVPSDDPNTLDDYEEGTFTPTVFGGTTPGKTTYGTRSGKYTKVGNVVMIDVRITVTSMDGTGALYIGGLPFSAINTGAMFDIPFFDEALTGQWKGIFNGSSIEVYLINNGSLSAQAVLNFSIEIRFKGHYFVS